MARHSTAEDEPLHFEAQSQFWKAVQGRIPTATGRLGLWVTSLQSRTGISGSLHQVSSSTPNHFLADVSPCSFSFCGCGVHFHQLLLSLLSFPLHGWLFAQGWAEKGICRQQNSFSQLAGEFGGCHTMCGWDTAPNYLPSASVPFPSQSGVILDDARCLKAVGM